MKRRYIWQKIAVVLLAFAAALIPQAAAAANFTYDTEVTYTVRPDGVTTDVVERYRVTNQTPRFYLTELQLSTPAEQLSGLTVSYGDGAAIPATTSAQTTRQGDVDIEYQQIKLTFPRQIVGQGRQWEVVARYQTRGLAETRGGSHTVYVPSIEPTNDLSSYRAIVEVPKSFGGAHFTGAKASSSGTRGEYQVFRFDRAELQKSSLALSFGDLNRYEFTLTYPLKNKGLWPQTQRVTLPPNLNNQSATITKLEPMPRSTYVDADGNLIAEYRLNPGQSVNVQAVAVVEVRHRSYDLSKSGKSGDIPAQLIERYTGSTAYWSGDASVREAAARVSDPNAPVIKNVQAMYQLVIDRLSYNDEKIKFNIRQGAQKALANPSNAVCLEYADLLVAMLRSQGIPARMPIGYAYSGDLKTSPEVVDSLHSWVEAYVPGIGWMTLDPTWGEKFDEFGASDLDHAAFTVWGEGDETPAAIMADGRDTGYQYETSSLRYVDAAPVAAQLPGPAPENQALYWALGAAAIGIASAAIVALHRHRAHRPTSA